MHTHSKAVCGPRSDSGSCHCPAPQSSTAANPSRCVPALLQPEFQHQPSLLCTEVRPDSACQGISNCQDTPTTMYVSATGPCHCTGTCRWSLQPSVCTPLAIVTVAARPGSYLLDLEMLLRTPTAFTKDYVVVSVMHLSRLMRCSTKHLKKN